MDREQRMAAGQTGGLNIERGNLSVGEDVNGHVKVVGIHIFRAELDQVFQPLADAVAGNDEASKQVEALKREAAKGYDADDSVLARLVKSIMALAPGALSALLSTFAAPALGGVAGPVTKWALSEIQFK